MHAKQKEMKHRHLTMHAVLVTSTAHLEPKGLAELYSRGSSSYCRMYMGVAAVDLYLLLLIPNTPKFNKQPPALVSHPPEFNRDPVNLHGVQRWRP